MVGIGHGHGHGYGHGYAIGITSKGEIKEFKCPDGMLYCNDKDLVSLTIHKGVKLISCSNNLLTELVIPDTAKVVYCDMTVKGLEHLIGDEDIILKLF